MRTIDTLFHFTRELATIESVVRDGLLPSYAKETLAGRDKFVPMISFSNVQLGDIGSEPVIYYGDYAICFDRQWGIENAINPVIYTYDDGIVNASIRVSLNNSIFLSSIDGYKEIFKKTTQSKRKFTGELAFEEGVSSEASRLVDFLSLNHNEELLDLIAAYAKQIAEGTMPIIQLTKPHKVYNSSGREFIAYNDREWRKIYPKQGFMFKEEFERSKWFNVQKPHFQDSEFALKTDLRSMKAILVKSQDEVQDVVTLLNDVFGEVQVGNALTTRGLLVGDKPSLISAGL